MKPLPERPRRRMPPLWAIAKHWDRNGTFGAIRLDDTPHCFRCLREVPDAPGRSPRDRWNHASPYLDRAHLVDRAEDGLDGPQNMVPLCHECHDAMPVFAAAEGEIAIRWVLAGWQLCLWIPREARIAAGIRTLVTDWPAPRRTSSTSHPAPAHILNVPAVVP